MRAYIMAACAALALGAAAEDAASNFYLPTFVGENQVGICNVYIKNGGKTTETGVLVKDDGSLLSSEAWEGMIKGYKKTNQALATAIEAAIVAAKAEIETKNLALKVWDIMNNGMIVQYTDNMGKLKAARATYYDSSKRSSSGITPTSTLTTGKVIVDYKSLNKYSNGKLEIKGWSGDAAISGITLSTLFSGEAGEYMRWLYGGYQIPIRSKVNGELVYLEIGGALDLNGSNVCDNVTIAKDEDFRLHLKFSENMEVGTQPHFPTLKNTSFGDGDLDGLEWMSAEDFADGETIEVHASTGSGDANPVARFGVKGAHEIASSGKYFGSNPVGYPFTSVGWYDLPNTTTNNLEADHVHLDTVTEGDTKAIKLMSTFAGGTYGITASGFAKIEDALGASADGKSVETNATSGALQLYHFDEASIGQYAKVGTDGNLTWGSAVEPDGASIETNETDGALQIYGFDDASGNKGACGQNLAEMMTNASNPERDKHSVLTRHVSGGSVSLHYTPLGEISALAAVDGHSIVSNEMSGEISIKGAANATARQIPVKATSGETGDVEWRDNYTGGFSYVSGAIKGGTVMVGRTPVSVTGISASSGSYRIKVTLGTSTPSAVIEQGAAGDPSGNTSYLPLFTIESGKITEDRRGCFVVPVFE